MDRKAETPEDVDMPNEIAQAVHDLWGEIRRSNRVVIFCGAGVTIGRTGISWNDLVTEVARHTLCCDHATPDYSKACSDFFNSQEFSAEQKATVAVAKAPDRKTISRAISETLYRNSGYKEGRMLNALAELVIGILLQDKRVDIITTNYDTHIENRIIEKVKLYKEAAELTQKRCPHVTVSILKDDGSEEIINEKGGGGATVNLLYVHGRIDDKENTAGTVVFSESDYEESHDRTTKRLMELFKDAPTIIVGSSLVDTPLIRSLSGVARVEGEGESQHYHRYAVMERTIACNKDTNFLQLLRAERLGLKPLFFDYYDEIPDIFWNLCAFLAKGVDVFHGALPCDIAKNDWMKQVEKRSHQRAISMQVYEYSAQFAREIRDKYVPDGEYIKFEFWFLEGNDGPSRKRFLTVWSNSAGPIFTRGLRRREEVIRENVKHVASLRSFVSGGPNLIPLEALGIGSVGLGESRDTSSSRWRSFFSVPIIRKSVVHKTDKERIGTEVEVTIGVVTLASTYCLAQSRNSDFCGMDEDSDIDNDFNDPGDRESGPSQTTSFLSSENDPVKKTLRDVLMELGEYASALMYSDEDDAKPGQKGAQDTNDGLDAEPSEALKS